MNVYSASAKYDLTSTCIKPMSIKELLTLCPAETPFGVLEEKLTYGDIQGSVRLKKAIKNLYRNHEIENIIVTHGAIGANELVFKSVLEKEDDVIVFVPTYQQHYSLPKSLGANVKFIMLHEENGWLPNLREFENAMTRKTKLVCLANPNNPTGAVLSDEYLKRIVDICKVNNSWLLADEAYRGLNLNGNRYSESIADLYEKGISTGSMSKAYSLPGLRVGWVVARKDLISEISKHREYNTISISMLDDYYSAIALENQEYILERNFEIIRAGYNVLKNWLNGEIYIKANLPQGGTTAILRYRKDISSRKLCKDFQRQTGIALLPGFTMDIEGTVRLGYCQDSEMLKNCLKQFSKYLRTIQ